MGQVSVMRMQGDDWCVTAQDGMFIRVTAPGQTPISMYAAVKDCRNTYEVQTVISKLNETRETSSKNFNRNSTPRRR